MTVRHLLSNTAGFDGDVFDDTGRGDDALERYVHLLRDRAGQSAAPGALYSYNNAGFSVAGLIVARLRGGTWEDAMRERIAEPLGTRVALFAEEAVLFRVSAGHLRHGDGYAVSRQWLMASRAVGPAGATVCAAPRDLVRFGRMFLDGGAKVLSAAAVDAMITPQATVPGAPGRQAVRYGLGMSLFDWNGTAVYGHDGGTIGQSTIWRVLPGHDLVIAVSANGGETSVFFDAVIDPIVRELTGVVVPPRPVPPATPRTDGLERLAGRYEYPLYTYDVTVADGGLELTVTPKLMGGDAEVLRLVRLADDTFITVEPDDGTYSTVTFLDGGSHLHDGRAARRIR